MKKKYKYISFIGRFEPLHVGHAEVIQRAFDLAENVIIFVGSARAPSTPKNPWSFAERKQMIDDFIADTYHPVPSYTVVPLRDVKYNDHLWAAQVQNAVDDIISPETKFNEIAIIGHTKDETSYYLKMFPQWEQVEHPLNENVSATKIRSFHFEGMSHKFYQAAVPNNVLKFLLNYDKNRYAALCKEHEYIRTYKQGWSVAPYQPKHVTVDAVVVQSGHILLVTRTGAPGEGLTALPGGHVEANETLIDAMIRELKEETKLKVPANVIKGSIKKMEVFDDPSRSQIGRVITHAYYVELAPGELPPVKGSNETRKVRWVPISKLEDEMDESVFFDDHYFIIQKMMGKI